MESIPDFEDMLELLEEFGVRYLIIGGLAFIFHAKPRYTKDMDLWIDPSPENLEKANAALVDFGSPFLLETGKPTEVLQLGVAPHRIDLLKNLENARFAKAWSRRVRAPYGRAVANWIGLDSLIEIKSGIDEPRHQEDARVLRQVRDLRQSD